ncbi:hypothetical protein P280DRAFT_470350 [Massarina eburnea CBS 473.64]|uniref:Uncharacterized protein n=1 Tax=Massarina eburnea CBS 473.64 TaxID=1395130 RepID=A0A6A6RXL3_9PLEO|nr:hypothetical protein P280DRAFT_470350 [Massarina eburnea CBS 473.64]
MDQDADLYEGFVSGDVLQQRLLANISETFGAVQTSPTSPTPSVVSSEGEVISHCPHSCPATAECTQSGHSTKYSAERVEFDARIERAHIEREIATVKSDEVDLTKRLNKREKNLEIVKRIQESSSYKSYYLPPPWSVNLVRTATLYPQILNRYCLLEERINKNLRERIDVLMCSCFPEFDNYLQTSRELRKLVEWGDNRGLLTPEHKEEWTTLSQILDYLTMMVDNAIGVRKAIGNCAEDEQDVLPIVCGAHEEVLYAMGRWPDLRKRWKALMKKERAIFPNRFSGDGGDSGVESEWEYEKGYRKQKVKKTPRGRLLWEGKYVQPGQGWSTIPRELPTITIHLTPPTPTLNDDKPFEADDFDDDFYWGS